MDLSRRMVLLDDTAAALRMIRAELATLEEMAPALLTMEQEGTRSLVRAEVQARVA